MSTRPKAPELYFPYPDCSVCGESTSHDGDSFFCEHCDIYWPDSGGEGEWYDEKAEQCPSTHQPFANNKHAKDTDSFKYETKRCLLASGHDGKHRVDSVTTWTDETAVNGRSAEVAS